jgi:hypothetical protein
MGFWPGIDKALAAVPAATSDACLRRSLRLMGVYLGCE